MRFAAVLGLCWATVASADDGGTPPPPPPCVPTATTPCPAPDPLFKPNDAEVLPSKQSDTPAPPPPITATAVPLPDKLDKQQIAFLKPVHSGYGPVPRGQTDFTAYSLEWGEVKLGLAQIQIGVLPRTQIGTVPVLDVLKVPNVDAKVDAFRFGPVDIAAMGAYFVMPVEGFTGRYLAGGGMASVILFPAWSIHGGAQYVSAHGEGFPDLTKVSSLLTDLTGSEVADFQVPDEAKNASGNASAVLVKFATDVRLNRRDSFVLQFQGVPWAKADYDLGFVPPPILGFNQSMTVGGQQPLGKTYLVTLSYQATFQNVDLRLGGGLSAVPYTWIVQAENLSYRFFGSTRAKEHRADAFYRKNKGKTDVPPAPAPAAPVAPAPAAPVPPPK